MFRITCCKRTDTFNMTADPDIALCRRRLDDHLECMALLPSLTAGIVRAGHLLTNVLAKGRKLLVCGNGGSAADAQHFTAEIVGRFEKERTGWAALALTTDTSILTAVGNDYGYADIFARQVQALGCDGDALIGISTSGCSENVVKAFEQAAVNKIHTIGLLGRDGGPLKQIAGTAVVVPHQRTATIQEAHIFILHLWAELIETLYFKTRTEAKADDALS